MLLEYEKTLIVPDLHGRSELLRAILSTYASIDHMIIAGDFVDGRDTSGVMSLLAEQDPEFLTVLLGNHEWVLNAAMHEQNEDSRVIWAEGVWHWPYHNNVLRSYGIEGAPSLANATRLRGVMPDSHQQVFQRAKLFAEGDDFIVVHAGLYKMAWETQKQYLERKNELRRQGDFGDGIPVQLSGEHVMTELDIATSGLEKRLITGHWHQPDRKRRVKAGGKLIHLAGLTEMSHIPVYETWTDEIKLIAA